MLAPAEVGGDVEVQQAGCLSLCSEHAVICVREGMPVQGGGWVIALGLGSYQRALKGRHASLDEALAAGIVAWLAMLNARIAEITRARGGTLEWGLPVMPRAEPIVRVARLNGKERPREGTPECYMWSPYDWYDRRPDGTEIAVKDAWG
jgi:hypothetical protein